MKIRGKVEQFNRRLVTGWLTIEGFAEAKPTLELVLDGAIRQVVAADRFRPDLEEAGMGDGACSYEIVIDPPLTKAELGRAQLRIGGSALCLEIPRPNGAAHAEPDAARGEEADGLKVFIVGSPRSGTSVLLRAIQHEFDLPGSGESHVVPAIAKVAFELRRYYERFRDTPNGLLIHKLPISDFERTLFDQVRSFYGEIYADGRWVDKTPSDEAVHSAGLIKRIFPDARIIVTKRNGIEVADSYRRKFNASIENAALSWASVMQGVENLLAAHPDLLVVDQFQFTNDSEGAGAALAQYLGKPESGPRLAAFLRRDREDVLSTHDWRERVTLDDVSWSDEEKAVFEKICGAHMQKNGFALK